MPRTRAAAAIAAALTLAAPFAAEAGKGPNKRHPHKPKPAFPTKHKPKLPKVPSMPSVPAADPVDQKLAGKVFELEFTASRSVSWKTPTQTKGDCKATYTTSSSGDDDWNLRSGGWHVKIVPAGDGYAFVLVPRKYHVYPAEGMTVGGSWTRSAETTTTMQPGWCGGGEEPKKPKTDCGSRKPRYLLGISAHKGRGLSVALSRASDAAFKTCPVFMPIGMPSEPSSNQTAAFDPKEILENKGGSFRFSQDYEGDGTFGTLEWVVRLEERD
ncbi:MAG TPA: hypothetical protein VIL49_04370 [Capillimicrobium sp.]|jgi:hypothetical protein